MTEPVGSHPLVDFAADIILLHDLSGRIVDVNSNGCVLLGYARDELLRMAVFDLDGEARVGAGIWARLEAGRFHTVEGRITRKDGSTFPVEVRLGAWGTGDAKLITAVLRDISDRRLAEQKLRKLHEELRVAHADLERRIDERTRSLRQSQELSDFLLDSVERWVLVIDDNGQIVKANASAISLFGQDLVGRPLREVQPGDESGSVERTLETGRSGPVERAMLIGGKVEVVRIQTYAISSDARMVGQVAQVGRLLTSERETEARVAHHERMAAFGLLAAGIAHDMGNPLSSIKSQFAVSRDQTDPEAVRETLAVVEKEVDRIAVLLRSLVSFARRRRSSMSAVSLNQVVSDVTRLLSHHALALGVRVEHRFDAGEPTVLALEDELVHVLLALGGNALEAMGGSGRLTFETRIDGDEFIVRVQDTGGGVPEALATRIFEPLFTTKESRQGMGLFVSRGLVERMGGRLELQSTDPAGATFCLTLPRERSSE